MKTENISISPNEKLGLISNLTTMLSAGIPILETVDSISDGSKGNVKKILETLRADLIQGQKVYVSFSRFPRIFNKVTVNIIKASEEAGTLDTTLRDIKESIVRDSEFNDKIRSALIYPVFIVGVFFAVLFMILIVVVPKISTVFGRLKVELPLPTQILIFASNIVTKNTFAFLLAMTVLISASVYIYKRKKKALFQVFFAFPVLSNLAKEVDLVNFFRSLHFLLNAGIPIPHALDLTTDVVKSRKVSSAIDKSKEMVMSGKKLSEGFETAKDIFPSILIKITEAGERSGTLDKSMRDASEFLDYQVSRSLKTVTALLEPVMLVVIGILIGGMMLAIIAPIYGLIGQVGR